MKIVMASDHAGLNLKAVLRADLEAAGHDVTDLGAHTTDSVDYPDFGYALAETIAAGAAERGVLVCGTGIGISIAANRNPAVRAALVTDPTGARLSREHNDANVICLGERTTGVEVARDCLNTFLATEFAGDRHIRRVEKLSNPTNAKATPTNAKK